MNIEDFIKKQQSFDASHGWTIDKTDSKKLLVSLQQNSLGIVAELGEFVNVLKKIERENPEHYRQLIEEKMQLLHEEAIDIFIYLLRIFNELDINVNSMYRKKLEINHERFKKFSK